MVEQQKPHLQHRTGLVQFVDRFPVDVQRSVRDLMLLVHILQIIISKVDKVLHRIGNIRIDAFGVVIVRKTGLVGDSLVDGAVRHGQHECQNRGAALHELEALIEKVQVDGAGQFAGNLQVEQETEDTIETGIGEDQGVVTVQENAKDVGDVDDVHLVM